MTLRASRPLQIFAAAAATIIKNAAQFCATNCLGFHNQMVDDAARLVDGNKSGRVVLSFHPFVAQETGRVVRKLIAFDDDTLDKLTQLGRDRMATIQELADEAFADLLRKHGIPIDLKDALRKSAGRSKAVSAKTPIPRKTRPPGKAISSTARKTRP